MQDSRGSKISTKIKTEQASSLEIAKVNNSGQVGTHIDTQKQDGLLAKRPFLGHSGLSERSENGAKFERICF